MFLVIDTSTEQGVIAVFDNTELLKEVHLSHGLRNSRSLLPELEKLFQELDLRPQDLDFVAVGIGPGSYTGVRVGVVVAKMIHMTCRIPLVGVSSLKAFVPSNDGRFAAVLDARIAGIYYLCGDKKGDKVSWLGEPKVCEHLPDVSCFVTSHEKLKQKNSGDGEWIVMPPSGSALGLEALKEFKLGNIAHDGHLDILYLRKTQAERELK